MRIEDYEFIDDYVYDGVWDEDCEKNGVSLSYDVLSPLDEEEINDEWNEDMEDDYEPDELDEDENSSDYRSFDEYSLDYRSFMSANPIPFKSIVGDYSYVRKNRFLVKFPNIPSLNNCNIDNVSFNFSNRDGGELSFVINMFDDYSTVVNQIMDNFMYRCGNDYIKPKENNIILLEIFDPTGVVVCTYTFLNVLLTTYNGGEFSYGDSDLHNISLNFKFDNILTEGY